MNQASISSQLGNLPCKVKDTPEITALREEGKHQELGNALCGQYRYREAVLAYTDALYQDPNDIRLWQSFAGANVVVRNFRAAEEGYRRSMMLGGQASDITFSLGFCTYLQKRYTEAMVHFAASYPCDEEQEIAVLYWHTLASIRANMRPRLLENYREGMEVGMHVAYEKIVRLFCGLESPMDIVEWIHAEDDELNIIIALYGMVLYYESVHNEEKRITSLAALLSYDQYWPSFVYLAAFSDDAFGI